MALFILSPPLLPVFLPLLRFEHIYTTRFSDLKGNPVVLIVPTHELQGSLNIRGRK